MSNFSIVCGTKACNAKCPFCISKMTDACVDELPVEFDWNRFDKACKYVSRSPERPTQTALITGRGEPTLYSQHLSLLIRRLNLVFPCIELQTNGIKYRELPWEEYQTLGLNTIAISVCSLDPQKNNKVMGIKGDFDVRECIRYLSQFFTIRIGFQITKAGTGLGSWYSHIDWVEETINQAKELGAKQLTLREVGTPDKSANPEAAEWVKDNAVGSAWKDAVSVLGKKLSTYHWGGMIYDVKGMSVCVADCLTESPDTFEPRSWIFDGKHLRYSWQYEGAIIF